MFGDIVIGCNIFESTDKKVSKQIIGVGAFQIVAVKQQLYEVNFLLEDYFIKSKR